MTSNTHYRSAYIRPIILTTLAYLIPLYNNKKAVGDLHYYNPMLRLSWRNRFIQQHVNMLQMPKIEATEVMVNVLLHLNANHDKHMSGLREAMAL